VKEVIEILDDFEIGYFEMKSDLPSWILQRAHMSSPGTMNVKIG
jgi:hypothetical protein